MKRRLLSEDLVLTPNCWRKTPARARRRLGDRPTGWYGSSAEWLSRLERGLLHQHPGQVSASSQDRGCFLHTSARLRVYNHSGLHIPGRAELVPVRIEFHEQPPYDTYGLAPQHYPRVFADPGASSKHRMPDDDALCLYYPTDLAKRRWTAPDGLVSLLNIVRNHLFCELRWRNTGGHTGGVWPLDEAEHGFAQKVEA